MLLGLDLRYILSEKNPISYAELWGTEKQKIVISRMSRKGLCSPVSKLISTELSKPSFPTFFYFQILRRAMIHECRHYNKITLALSVWKERLICLLFQVGN